MDSAAAAASGRIGAEAFTRGNHVAFGRNPSLFTAAHEAAHVIQQRAGVQLPGGVGQAGDEYEKHANEVASSVTQGASSESLLDAFVSDTTQQNIDSRVERNTTRSNIGSIRRRREK